MTDKKLVTEEDLKNPDFPIPVTLMAVQAIRSFGSFPDTECPTTERSGTLDGWDYTIWIGPIPTRLYALLGLPEVPVDPVWTKINKLYVTIRMRKEQFWPLGQIPNSFIQVPPLTLPHDLQKHMVDAERVMSVLVAQLELIGPFISDKVRTLAPLFVVLPGDGWRPVTKMRVSGRTEDLHETWDVAAQLTTTILGDEMPKPIRNALGPATRWLLRARNEPDDLKSFIFGYVGLEAFASAMYKELEKTVVTTLSTASGEGAEQPLGEAVIHQLLWPHDQENKRNPYRSFRFRFAIISAALSPQTAGSDDWMIAKLSQLRNKIHGGDLHVEWTDASDVTQLLRRYVTLAGKHFTR